MSNNVIKYGPSTLARLVAELDEPHTYDAATLIAASAWRETLAANLATAGALCRAFQAGIYAAASWWSGQLDSQRVWEPGCGRPMPGWE